MKFIIVAYFSASYGGKDNISKLKKTVFSKWSPRGVLNVKIDEK